MARTHCSINAFILGLIAIFSITLVAACENTARGLKLDAAEAEVDTRVERFKAVPAAGIPPAEMGPGDARVRPVGAQHTVLGVVGMCDVSVYPVMQNSPLLSVVQYGPKPVED